MERVHRRGDEVKRRRQHAKRGLFVRHAELLNGLRFDEAIPMIRLRAQRRVTAGGMRN